MSKFTFDLRRKELVDKIRDPLIYQFNLAKHLALLSNDPAIIRRFYQVDIMQHFKDAWLIMEIEGNFFRHWQPDQAFSYFGLIPTLVQSMVNLVAGSGFKSKTSNPNIDDLINTVIEKSHMQELFADGVYWEAGIGDVAYRINYNAEASDKPLIDIIEPHHLEINYNRNKVISYVIKEVSEDDPLYELHEIHWINEDGFLTITYRFAYEGNYVAPNDTALIKQCELHFDGVDTSERVLPFTDFVTIVYKKNSTQNKLYRGQRGVPDIQGIDTVEASLTEAISDLMDAIRKGGIRVYADKDLIPQNAEGQNLRFNFFNKFISAPKGTGNADGSNKLYQVIQADIQWESYVKSIEVLISNGSIKCGLSPTTIGQTGLESINSSAESQEAREKTSLRTRELKHNSWRPILRELLDKYLRVNDYINGREIENWSELINIQFDDYISPSIEAVTDVVAKQVDVGIKSKVEAIQDINDDINEREAQAELDKINGENLGIPPTQMVSNGIQTENL